MSSNTNENLNDFHPETQGIPVINEEAIGASRPVYHDDDPSPDESTANLEAQGIVTESYESHIADDEVPASFAQPTQTTQPAQPKQNTGKWIAGSVAALLAVAGIAGGAYALGSGSNKNTVPVSAPSQSVVKVTETAAPSPLSSTDKVKATPSAVAPKAAEAAPKVSTPAPVGVQSVPAAPASSDPQPTYVPSMVQSIPAAPATSGSSNETTNTAAPEEVNLGPVTYTGKSDDAVFESMTLKLGLGDPNLLDNLDDSGKGSFTLNAERVTGARLTDFRPSYKYCYGYQSGIVACRLPDQSETTLFFSTVTNKMKAVSYPGEYSEADMDIASNMLAGHVYHFTENGRTTYFNQG